MKYFTADMLRGNLEIGAFKGGGGLFGPKFQVGDVPPRLLRIAKLQSEHKKYPPQAPLRLFLIFQLCEQIFAPNFTQMLNKKYTLYHQVWLKYI